MTVRTFQTEPQVVKLLARVLSITEVSHVDKQ